MLSFCDLFLHFLNPDQMETEETRKSKKPKDNDVWAINYDDDGKFFFSALLFDLTLEKIKFKLLCLKINAKKLMTQLFCDSKFCFVFWLAVAMHENMLLVNENGICFSVSLEMPSTLHCNY